MADDDRYLLAVEEARRSVDQQKEDLKAVRDRSTAVITVSSLVAAFLGGLALRDKAVQPGYWTFAGVVAFVLIVIIVALGIMWPRSFTFGQNPQEIVSWVGRDNAEVGEMRRDLALHLKTHYDANQTVLDLMFLGYRVSLGLLAVEILTLLIDLRGR